MRRILYVDGFNFYYGVSSHWRNRPERLAGLGWCNFAALVERNFQLPGPPRVKYFTAPITQSVELPGNRPGENGRYHGWIRALKTIPDLHIVEGFYKGEFDKRSPSTTPKSRVEKQTDVNLAVELMIDTFSAEDLRPKHVFILSDDHDLMPAVFAVQERALTPIRITMLLPPASNERHWEDRYQQTRSRLLRHKPAHAPAKSPTQPIEIRVLDESMLSQSLLSYTLRDEQGEFFCPDYWKLSTAYLERHCLKREWRPDLIA